MSNTEHWAERYVMTSTTLPLIVAALVLLVTPAYAMQDAGQTGEYDQDETTQCQCGGGGDFMRPLHRGDSKTPGSGKVKRIDQDQSGANKGGGPVSSPPASAASRN